MTCTHRLNGGVLVCQRTDDHDPTAVGGHSYTASWASDPHDRAEAEK